MLRRNGMRFAIGSNDIVFTPGVVLPKRMLLVRHGLSEGNVDKTLFQREPDWRHPLAAEGERQAAECGKKICELIKDEPVALYTSPYIRARQTTDIIRESLNANQTRIVSEREDLRLREQDVGNLQSDPDTVQKQWAARDEFSRLLYRFNEGESGADASDRAASFIESFFRERQLSAHPDDCNSILITHGLLIRLFIMRWFHLSVELFEQIKNPHNCQIIVMERYVQRSTGKRRMRLTAEASQTLNIPRDIVLDSRYNQPLPRKTQVPPVPLHVLHGRKPPGQFFDDDE